MPKLKPADKEQCQAEKPSGHTFMTLGGRPGDMIRCTNKPAVIATENKPGEDGQRGSMSICADCLNHFLKQMTKDFATFSEINTYIEESNNA